MASKTELAIEALKSSLVRKVPAESMRLAMSIAKPFEGDGLMTGLEIDLAISKVFDAEQGLLVFLAHTIKLHKLHSPANNRVLELFNTICTGEHKKQVTDFAPAIVEQMLAFVLSSDVTASEKERATVVLHALVKGGLCGQVPIKYLLAQLLQVFNNGKATGKFLEHVYELLGLIAFSFPSSLAVGQSIQIRNMFLKTLEDAALSMNHMSLHAMGGAVVGLRHLLVHFAPSPTDEPDICRRIYILLQKFCAPYPDGATMQRNVARVSYDLLAAHAPLFAKHVSADHLFWYTRVLFAFTCHKNAEHHKSLFAAINAVLGVIAEQCEQPSDGEAAVVADQVFGLYIESFKLTLQNSESKSYEILIAVRGLGLMAGACKQRRPSVNLVDILSLLMRRTESLCPTPDLAVESVGAAIATDIAQPGFSRAALEHYPDFVRALSQIMKHVHQLTGMQLHSLQTILVSLMSDFCYLPVSYHEQTVVALLQTFAELGHVGGAVLDEMMTQCTMRSMVWMCSHRLQIDAHADWDVLPDWKDHITVAAFHPLWLGLTVDDFYSPDSAQARVTKRQFYQQVMDALFMILERVDLSLKPRGTADGNEASEPTYMVDPNSDLEPCRPADFHLFFNLVQLFEHLLASQTPSGQQQVFDSYIGRYFEVLERKSRDHPLVSGFVRLMTVGLQIANKMDYFNAHPAATPAVVQRYVRTQVARVTRVQGELQIASLMSLFSVPIPFLTRSTSTELAAVYQCGFVVGHVEMRVAKAALQSLEAMMLMSSTYADEVLRIVLPSLDTYLQTSGGVIGEVGVYRAVKAVNGKTGRKRNRRLLKVSTNYAETEMLNFQKLVLMFLGTLTQQQCLYMIGADDDDNDDSDGCHGDMVCSAPSADPVANCTITRPQIDNLVRLTLHFGDVEPTIHLDAFVPRICTLATSAGERNTKIAACELLHSIVLYVIGTRHFESALWRTLCAHMLQLGSDGDAAVRQMFEPLVEQTMHYMSHPAQLTVSNFRVLLDCLMAGMADRRSTGVRDLAARSLCVFVEWTVRQNAASAALVVHEIVDQLRMYSFDSDEQRRSGAALAFNSICRVVREQDQLVDIIWLDMLYTFAINFQLSEQYGFNASVATDLQQVDAAMDHVARVLRERSAMFAVASSGRTLPEPFAEATLEAGLAWLMTQCGCAQRLFRRKCIALVQQLAPLINNCGSLRSYIRDTQTVSSLLAICQMPAEMPDTPNGPRLNYRRVLAAMDFYMWIVGEAQWADGNALLVQSNVVSSVASCFNRTLSASSSAYLAEWHAYCVERSYAFLVKMLPIHDGAFAASQFWTKCHQAMARSTSQLLFEPHKLAFHVPRNVVEVFLARYPHVVPSAMAVNIKMYLESILVVRYDQLLATTEELLHRPMVSNEINHSARGILTLLDSGHKFTATSEPMLLQRIFNGLSEQRLDEAHVNELWPDVRRYAGVLLRIAFHTNPFNQLIHMVLNERPLIKPGGSVILHGQYFLNVFSAPIFEKLLNNMDQTFRVMVRQLSVDNALFMSDLIRNMVQYVRRKRCHERTVLCEMAVSISLVSWKLTSVHGAIAETDENLSAWSALAFANLDLVTHAAVIWPDALIVLGQQFNHLQSFICGLIVSRFATMDLKARAIFLLPCLIDHLTESHPLLEETFCKLQEQHFPILSTEFAESSMERASFVNVLQSLLDALVASRSPALLRFIIDATVADDEHILESAIRQALSTLCRSVANGSSANALIALRVPFQIFADRRLEPAVRLNVFRRFMLPMLRDCGAEAVERFYCEYLGTILEWSDYQYEGGAGGWSVEHALVSRIGAFQLIEIMAGAVSKESMAAQPELMRWVVPPAKSLVAMLSAKTFNTRKETFVSNDPTATSLFRRYNCAAYSAMCSLVANTQTTLLFYEKLLFREVPDSKEFIWRRIVDCRDGALFARHMPIDFDELPQRKERLASIQLAGSDSSHRIGRKTAAVDRLTMQTQNVFESSFSQDVTKIDLSHCAVRSKDQVTGSQTHYSVELERGPINDNEVMTVLCAVIRSMFDKGITPLPDLAAGEQTMVAPGWAQNLCSVLENPSEPRNTRYFVVKLVDNCREQFQHYAPSMYGAVLAFLVDEFERECTKSSNYFFNDLVVTLLGWSRVYKLQLEKEIDSASTVLRFLMKNAWHERRAIFRQRTEVIRHLLVVWLPSGVALPLQLLVDSIRYSAKPSSLKNLGGLQINAVVMSSGGQLTWTDRLSTYYIKHLVMNLDNDHKQLYKPAAYLLGIVLSQLIKRTEDDTDDNPYLRPVIMRLDHYRQIKLKEKRFLDVLFAIHRNYPRIVVSFLVPIANLVAKSCGPMKRQLLEMFQATMDVYGGDMFRELLSLGLVDLLHKSEYELAALHCINKALPHMTDEDTLTLWPHLVASSQSHNADARAVTCEIFVYIVMHATGAQLQTDALTQLLRGLQDGDARIRRRVYDFWATCDQLPQQIERRLLGVLDILYNPAVEEHFIGFGTQLVLHLAIESARARQPIFPHHATDPTTADLAEYQIDVSWSGRNSSMRAPLFVPSQHSKYARTTQGAGQMLLATVNDSQMAFEPTQAPAEPCSPSLVTQFGASSNFAQMMFTVAPLQLDRRSQRIKTTASHSELPEIHALLRERYLASTTHDDATRLNPRWVANFRDPNRKSAPTTGRRPIRLYRRYRRGDFPDLVINNLVFLLPLQALAQYDRLLGSQLFVAIYARVTASLDAGACRPFLLSSSDAVQAILRESKRCDPLVFSTLMQLAQQHPQHFDLSAELVASLAITNRSIAAAIGYLERRLHYSWDTDGPRSSAKSNSNTVDVEHQHWLKLSELYRALSEPDIVAGIFADKLDVDGHVPRALELESAGDLEAAQRVYLEVIKRGKVLETDFAYQSYYELYAAMGDWSALAVSCDGQLDSVEDVWADDWSMDTLLPHMMRARCRQVLRGDEASRDFVHRLEQWGRIPARASLLSVQYGEELMMMHMAAGQLLHARLYGDQKLQAFLAEWPSVSVLSRKMRTEKLLGIRTVAEMQGCTNLLLIAEPTMSAVGYQRLASRWTADRPISGESANLWETLVAYRSCVVGRVPQTDANYTRLGRAVASTQFRLLSLALEQRNVALANRIVQVVPAQRDEQQWQVLRCEHQSLKAAVLGRTTGAQVKLQLKAWDGVERVLTNGPTDPTTVRLRAYEVFGDIAFRLAAIVRTADAADIEPWTAEIGKRLGDADMSVSALADRLLCHTFENITQRVHFSVVQSTEALTGWFAGQDRGSVYFQLAEFCQHMCVRNSTLSIADRDRIYIESVFWSMQLGCDKARQAFPRILEMPELHTSPDLQRLFNTEADLVPEWMFLAWIPQMLSVFSFDRPGFVDLLLLRVAQAFPLAVCYPFQLAYARHLEEVDTDFKYKDVVIELVCVLMNPTVESFVQALQCLCVPEKKMHYHLRALYIELNAHDEDEDGPFLVSRLRRLNLNMWPDHQQRGRAYDRLEVFRTELRQLEDWTNIRDAQDAVRALLSQIDQAMRGKPHQRDTMRTLSPWLSSFHWCGATNSGPSHLELPGQYIGTRPPNSIKHTRIIKFDERIRIYDTLRQPVRLRCCGTDGRTYTYLLKYGEDLRQDQRIQQLLTLMQQQLRADAHCRAHSLRLETYTVVPINVHCGLLGWVNDSPAMQSVVESWLQRHPPGVGGTGTSMASTTTTATARLRTLRTEHEQFIKAASGERPTAEYRRSEHFYGRAVVRYSRIQLLTTQRGIEQKLPVELVRGALCDMSASAEAFFALRANFASSLAALSVAHWLLGIGDRHLSNVLLNERTGRVVGIDFGLSFGAGTRDQNVPELLPFRLTPQFVQALSPFGVCGALQTGMVRALRCWRQGHMLLESCMEVFVREPTIDWLESARNRAQAAYELEEETDRSGSNETVQWEPAQRIEIARRKLRGANPRAVCSDELARGKIATHADYLEGYRRLVTGITQHNVRARLGDDELTATEQVQCLLDMATDPALQCISWSGMQPWI